MNLLQKNLLLRGLAELQDKGVERGKGPENGAGFDSVGSDAGIDDIDEIDELNMWKE